MGFRKDYHGGRSYAADPPDGHFGLTGWLMAKLKAMFQSAPPPADIGLPTARQDGSPYSLLGAGDRDPFPSHSGRPVFPMADWRARPARRERSRRPAASSDGAPTAPAHPDR